MVKIISNDNFLLFWIWIKKSKIKKYLMRILVPWYGLRKTRLFFLMIDYPDSGQKRQPNGSGSRLERLGLELRLGANFSLQNFSFTFLAYTWLCPFYNSFHNVCEEKIMQREGQRGENWLRQALLHDGIYFRGDPVAVDQTNFTNRSSIILLESPNKILHSHVQKWNKRPFYRL